MHDDDDDDENVSEAGQTEGQPGKMSTRALIPVLLVFEQFH